MRAMPPHDGGLMRAPHRHEWGAEGFCVAPLPLGSNECHATRCDRPGCARARLGGGASCHAHGGRPRPPDPARPEDPTPVAARPGLRPELELLLDQALRRAARGRRLERFR